MKGKIELKPKAIDRYRYLLMYLSISLNEQFPDSVVSGGTDKDLFCSVLSSHTN